MPPVQSPLSIYVVHHPGSLECRMLAGHLHDWFRLKQNDGDSTEAGLPVWFRAHLGPDGRVAPEIVWAEADINVLVVLIDDVMVADPTWRIALDVLVREAEAAPRSALVLLAPVDWSAFRLSYLFGSRNRVPVGDPRIENTPEVRGEDDSAGKEQRARRIAARARVLRRAVTEAATRELRKPAGSELPPPIDVFLSHAKRDGAKVAIALRDGMADFGQIKAWYDANELPPGYNWTMPMEKAVRDKTAALVSIVTDSYPTRYWCRREVNLARTPQELARSQNGAVTAWTVQPTVAVSRHDSNWSRPLAQLAQVPHIGWLMEPTQVQGRVEDVVDRLLLEALLVEFYRRYALHFVHTHQGPPNQHLVLLTWVPDPWSLVQLLGKLPTDDSIEEFILAYPGHGLRTAELNELRELVAASGRQRGVRVRLLNQERLDEPEEEADIPRQRIAVSAAGEAPDLDLAGVGPQLVDDVVVRLTRRLLERNAQVVYGGTFGNYAANLTQALIDTALGWDRNADARGEGPAESATDLLDPPFVNYSAWPAWSGITPRIRADLTGVCSFIEVDPDPKKPAPVPADQARTREDPAHAFAAADALTRMREASTLATDVRIVLAGKRRGWLGWLPGIAEEVAWSVEKGQLVLVVGGFGGCAADLAAYLKSPDAPWPASLTMEQAREKDQPFQMVLRAAEASERARERFEWLERNLSAWRKMLHDPDRWPFPGVSQQAVRGLLSCGSPSGAIDRILRLLPGVSPSDIRNTTRQTGVKPG